MSNEVTVRDAVEAYLEYLDNEEFEKAAEQFTTDAVYCHPPTFEGVREVEGREALLEYFAETRGPRDHGHEIREAVNGDGKGAVVGRIVGGEEDGNIFVSYAELNDGEISYYVTGVNEKPK